MRRGAAVLQVAGRWRGPARDKVTGVAESALAAPRSPAVGFRPTNRKRPSPPGFARWKSSNRSRH